MADISEPISANGVHQLKQGSTEAIKVLTELLNQHPDMFDARWLLNIAYMTLGEYPDGVPEDIKPRVGESQTEQTDPGLPEAEATTEVPDPSRTSAPAIAVPGRQQQPA